MSKISNIALLTATILAANLQEAAAFSTCNSRIATTSSTQLHNSYDDEPKKGFFANFFEELDAFVDDATSRRLGNGAQYYGKRKSSFYGKDDANKKRDSSVFDPSEDYRGPSSAGYFQWKQDPETGEMKPVTRMKNKVVEKRM